MLSKVFLILFFICFSLTSSQQQNLYSTPWLISIVESGNTRKFQFGMRNFVSSEEQDLFTKGHIQIRSPFFLYAFKRRSDGTSVNIEGNSTPQVFEQQHYYYFLKNDLSSINGFFYVLQDDGQCVTGTPIDETYCELKFHVQYYNTYKKARLAYEQLLNNIPTPRLVFGGANGIIASNSIDYFLTRYMTATWCPYRHGLWSLNYVTHSSSNNWDRRYHIYLGHDDATPTPNYYFSIEKNDLTLTTTNCNFYEAELKDIYYPSEFYPNCYRYLNISPYNINNETTADKTSLSCINKYWSVINIVPFYYEHVGYCKSNNRVFMIAQDLNLINKDIKFKFSCTAAGGPTYADIDNSQNYVLKKFNHFYPNIRDDVTLFTDTRTCDYNNYASSDPLYVPGSLTSTNCNDNLFYSCTITEIQPKYFDLSINVDNNRTRSGVLTGTITNTVTLSVRLNLHDPNN